MTESTESVTPPQKKPHLVRRLYNWTLSWADTPYGAPALAVLSFIESSFFPIPPDVLLIALCFSKPARWFRYALLCSVASVLGGVLGWYIGIAFWDFSSSFFFHYVPGFTPKVFDLVQQKYQANAFLAILTAAFTPIPYKVFTIASGVFDVPLQTLVLASAVGRSGRFFLVAILIRACGTPIRGFLERYFEWACIALFVLALLGFMAIKWLA
ncbi:MAG: cytochrome B [Lentisphaerae bacterium RIFOXYB12_FULL_65_16]|nr:MAG: cytochrome B [Lentisphaerae bacterium RIFOXYA12_64_32]OGV87957.1 MAG: cytochrome B [Lentisphaerae bacterium RIFOXYB12_FULL_65_16]